MSLFTKKANEVFAPNDASGAPREVVNQEAQVWGSEVEAVINAFISSGALIYDSEASLDADLAHAANSMAWVIGDPVAAKNGVYRKIGASGTGSWVRVGDLPYSFVRATDAGLGTANALQATTPVPVSESVLVMMNIFETNTGSPVTVSFNGGAALTVKTNGGNDVVAGGLVGGTIVLGVVSGSTFRLASDQASAAIVAAAEAAAERAEAAAALAGAGFIFPELLPRWNPSDASAAIEDACGISAASGGQVKLTAGKQYNFSQIVIAAGATVTAADATLRYDGSLTNVTDVVITVGANCVIDELNLSMPGTGSAGYPISVAEAARIDRISISSDVQLGGEGVYVVGSDVKLGTVVTDKLDRPLNLFNSSTLTPIIGFELGTLECTSYRRAFRAYHAYDWHVGRIISKGRSSNSTGGAGENSALIEGCSDWSIDLVWSEDSGEHPVRIGGSNGGGVTENWTIGRIVAIRPSGCPLKVNPPVKTTIAGTVAVTSGSAALTGTGTTFTTQLRVGANVRLTDTGEIYRIASITDNLTATLDRSVTTSDASSALEVMEAAHNGEVGTIVAIDVGEGSPTGNEELLRLSHVRGLTIGSAVAYTQSGSVTSQYGVILNDVDDVNIGYLAGEKFNAGFVSISGTSDIDADQFGGDVTNLTISRLAGETGGSNAIGVNTTFRLGKISIGLDGAEGWTTNLVLWSAGTLIDYFELSGRMGGSVAPAFSGVPNSDFFIVKELSYSNRNLKGGRAGTIRGDAIAIEQLLCTAFDPTNTVPRNLFLNASQATAGANAYGGSVELSRPGSSRRGAAAAIKQFTSTVTSTGWEFSVGGPTTASDLLQAAMLLTHERALAIVDGVTAPTTIAGWAQLYVDLADGDLKVKFGDGFVRTIGLDS
ncbi:hypothetical protein I6F15_11695 [Bradyrhizobium sp. BRP14]|nr:hypothetical protein [Bradyrhizobium sp. BRP14]